jgi:hypothetical protein
MNIAIFWDIAPCSMYVIRCFEAKHYLHLQYRKSAEQALPSLLLQAGFLQGWFSALKEGVISSSETSVHIRTARRYIPEDGDILKTRSYIRYIHTYIHTLHTYIHTLHTYIHTSIHTYIHYIHTHIRYIHTYVTYIHTLHTSIHTYVTYIHTYVTYTHTLQWFLSYTKWL